MNYLAPYLHTSDPSSLTFLIPKKGEDATRKKISVISGKLEKKAADNGYFWKAERIPLSDIYSLFRALEVAVKRGDGVLTYGALKPSAEEKLERGKYIHRRKISKKDGEATLYEVPRHWLILDIDEVELSSLGVSFEGDPDHQIREELIRAYLQTLPPELARAHVIYQWTGGAGLEGSAPRFHGWKKLKLRLFYHLAAPQLPATLNSWTKMRGVNCDDAIFSANQPIYVASPIFRSGLRAPLPERERLGMIRGEHESVDISQADLARVRLKTPTQKKVKAKSTTRACETLRPRKLTLEDYQVTRRGEHALTEALRAVRRSIRKGLSRHKSFLRATSEFISPAVKGGHLKAALAFEEMSKEASRQGLGADRIRQVQGAIQWVFDNNDKALAPPDPTEPKIKWGEEHQRDIRRAKADLVGEFLSKLAANTAEGELNVADIPAGAGKTYKAIEEALRAVRRGDRRVIAVKTAELAQEIEAKALLIDASVPVQIIRGSLAHCHHVAEFERQIDAGYAGARLLLENLRSAYRDGGRVGLCGRPDDPVERCEFAKECEGSKRPVAEASALVVITHAMIPHIKLDPSTIAYLDEFPSSFVDQAQTSQKELSSLCFSTSTPLIESWSRRVREGDVFQAALNRLWEILGRQSAETTRSAYTQRRHGLDLSIEELDPEGLLAALGRDVIEQEALHTQQVAEAKKRRKRHGAYALGSAPRYRYGAPPRQIANKVRAGLPDAVPSRQAFQLLLDIAVAAAGGEWPDSISIVIDPDGGARYERSTKAALPSCATIALDATGDRHRKIWEKLGERETKIHLLPLTGGAPRAEWLETSAYQTSNLYSREGGSVRWSKRSVGSMKKLAAELIELILSGARRVGMITHKPLAELLRAMIGEADPDAYKSDLYARQILEGPLCAELRELLCDKGGAVVVGHFGADDVGSNRFEREQIDTLMIVGSPTAELSAARAAIKTLGCHELTKDEQEILEGLEPDERAELIREIEDKKINAIYLDLTTAKLSQAIARLRALRKDEAPRLLYLGHVSPPDQDNCAPGIEWSHRKATTEKARSRERIVADKLCEEQLFEIGTVQHSLRVLQALSGCSRANARSAKKKLNDWYKSMLSADEEEGGVDLANPFISGFDTPLILPHALRFSDWRARQQGASESSGSSRAPQPASVLQRAREELTAHARALSQRRSPASEGVTA